MSDAALAWLWTLLAGAAAVLSFFLGQWLTGLLFILSGLIVCPLLLPLLEKQAGARLGGGLRFTFGAVFALLAALSVAQNPAALRWIRALNAPPPPPPPKTLAQAQGGFGNLKTKIFTPQGKDWNLEWSYDCSTLGDSGILDVKVLRQDGTLLDEVNKIGDRDAGTQHYHQAGSFRLQITSECQWGVRVMG